MSASGSAGATSPPTGGTQRCDNFATCGVLVTATSGSGLCSGCRNTVYCSAACQKAHWKTHKVFCKEVQRQRAKAASAVPTFVGEPCAFAQTLAAARAGDVNALFNMGVLYATGAGVAQSYSSAFSWFTRCAAQAAPPREVWAKLGSCYEHGRGVAKDDAEAVRLYRLGAAAGDAGAQFNLACCLDQAIGVPTPDFAAALALYTAAAAQDLPHAIMNLGVYYDKGRGVACDALRAIALYKCVLAHPRTAPLTVAGAAFNLGVRYGEGADGVPRDAELCMRYLRQAAALGHETAARLVREAGLS